MKKLLVILVVSAGLVHCKNADSPSGKNVPDSTSIQWVDSTFRDYGKVKKGDVLEVSFRFKNTGDQNLIIQDVKPGCGCTDGEKPNEPIAPGKEGVIKAKFKSGSQPLGEATKYITVLANVKSVPATDLSFRAEVTN